MSFLNVKNFFFTTDICLGQYLFVRFVWTKIDRRKYSGNHFGKKKIIILARVSQKLHTLALRNNDTIGKESEVISWGSSGIFGIGCCSSPWIHHKENWTGQKNTLLSKHNTAAHLTCAKYYQKQSWQLLEEHIVD